MTPGEALKDFVIQRLNVADAGPRTLGALAHTLNVSRQQLDLALLRPHWRNILPAALAAALRVTPEELLAIKPPVPPPRRGRPTKHKKDGIALPRGPGELARLVAGGLTLDTLITFRGETHPLSYHLSSFK